MTGILSNKAAVQGELADPLGYLAWYTIHNALRVSRRDLEYRFSDCGINLSFLPNRIYPADAFRRATSRVERTNLPVAGQKGLKVNLLVREVSSGPDQVVRHLVRELVDSNDVRLSYDTVGEFTLDRKSSRMRAVPWSPGDDVGAVLERAADLYVELLNNYEGEHLRRSVQQMLEDMRVTAVRPSGGVYFVPASQKEKLDSLGLLMKALDQEWFTLPVVDAGDTRDMVRRKFAEQINDAVESMTGTLGSDKISPAQVSSLIDRAKRLIEDVGEYEEVLDQDLQDLRSRVEIVKLQMISLLNKAA